MIPEHVNWDAVVQSVTDTWLPLMGWAVAVAVIWLVARSRRRP